MISELYSLPAFTTVPTVSATQRSRNRWSRRVIGDLLALADLGALAITALATAIWQGSPRGPLAHTGMADVAFCLVVMAASHVALSEAGAYRHLPLMDLRFNPLWLVATVCAAFAGVGLSVEGLSGPATISLGWLTVWLANSVLGLALVRLAAGGVLARAGRLGLLKSHVAVYGTGRIADLVAAQALSDSSGTHLVGVFDDRKDQRNGSQGWMSASGTLEALIAAGRDDKIDEIIVALPNAADGRIAEIVHRLEHLPVKISICTHISSEYLGLSHRAQSARQLGPVGLMDVKPKPLNDWAPFLKRIEDVTISGVALIALAPLFLVIACAIKMDSPGPVLFRQRRHGFNHRVFHVLKFRSMRVMEDGAKVEQAQRGDPRVTRVGRLLRRTSLDELPQLINIFLGDMSLVGPRPHAIAHNEQYETIVARYASRNQVKPGLTGWAQVNGFRGETNTVEAMRKRVEHDLEYIENWSLWLDIWVLIRTLRCGFVHRNAF